MIAWNTETGAIANKYTDADLTYPVHNVAYHPLDNIFACSSFGSNQPILLYYYVPTQGQ